MLFVDIKDLNLVANVRDPPIFQDFCMCVFLIEESIQKLLMSVLAYLSPKKASKAEMQGLPIDFKLALPYITVF